MSTVGVDRGPLNSSLTQEMRKSLQEGTPTLTGPSTGLSLRPEPHRISRQRVLKRLKEVSLSLAGYWSGYGARVGSSRVSTRCRTSPHPYYW